ncbi:hypothetical protein B0H11DRAFT_1877732 [Mycena galericulata]|nr:hypothetical protein B0H11DRAFT_1877732 [Mycena galericulata]
MPPSNHLDRILDYTTTAATILNGIANAASLPILSVPTVHALTISKMVKVRTNCHHLTSL